MCVSAGSGGEGRNLKKETRAIGRITRVIRKKIALREG
jgi:hypothetical protein